jgi:hypothetical protein
MIRISGAGTGAYSESGLSPAPVPEIAPEVTRTELVATPLQAGRPELAVPPPVDSKVRGALAVRPSVRRAPRPRLRPGRRDFQDASPSQRTYGRTCAPRWFRPSQHAVKRYAGRTPFTVKTTWGVDYSYPARAKMRYALSLYLQLWYRYYLAYIRKPSRAMRGALVRQSTPHFSS